MKNLRSPTRLQSSNVSAADTSEELIRHSRALFSGFDWKSINLQVRFLSTWLYDTYNVVKMMFLLLNV
jgi:hypothetical protein